MAPQIVLREERAVLARERNLGIAIWADPPSVEHIRAWHQLGKDIAKAHPGKGACFDVIPRGRPKFPDEMRKAAEEFASDPKIFELGIAHVVMLPGFAGTAVRAFIGTILLVARPPAPSRVFADVEEAARWMLPKVGPTGWSARTLQMACEEALSALPSL